MNCILRNNLLLLFSHSVVSNYLQPHGLQPPRACSNSCLLNQWCHPIILSSFVPFSCLQSLSASGSFPVSRFFASASASVSVLPMNIQGWFPLGWTGLTSLLSKGPQFEGISSLALSLFIVQLLHLYMTTGKTIALTIRTFVGKVISAF